jgi:hypothetical protein
MTTTPLKALVQGAYDVQKLRVAIGNRICQSFYQSRGVAPGDKPKEKLDAENQRLLSRIKSEYHGLASGMTRLKRDTFVPTEFLPDFVIIELCRLHEGLEDQEAIAFKSVERALDGHSVWEGFLKSVTGCGPAMAGVLLSTLDARRAEYPSCFWSYAGLDVAEDGRGRSRRKEHLVKRTYVNRDGETDERDSITFNGFLKTKLFVLASCFMRNGNPYYRAIYDNYKHRLENHPSWMDKTPGHRNNAARRYMLKIFLANLWNEWRKIEGLPIVPSYAEAKLGMLPHHRRAAE